MLVCTLLASYALNFFFINTPATTEIYTLSLHDALPISGLARAVLRERSRVPWEELAADYDHIRDRIARDARSEEHTSELQSRLHLVCRLLLEKKKTNKERNYDIFIVD